jgi:hypothetical protein
MSDQDLIRRGEVRKLLFACGLMGDFANNPLNELLTALPAVTSDREARLVEALRECREDWCARADADLKEQESDERIMDYPTPRKMTEAMRKADKLTAILAELETAK